MTEEDKRYDVLTREELESGNFDPETIAIIRKLKEEDDAHKPIAESTGTVREINKMENAQQAQPQQAPVVETLKQAAANYTPQHTKNVADLDRVGVNLELKEHVAKEGTPDEFKYKYIEVEGEKYRVPGVVIGDLKGLLSQMPDILFFKVLKQGTGTATKYQVIPCTDQQ